MWTIPIVQWPQKSGVLAALKTWHRVKRAWRRTGAVVGEHGRTTAGAQNKKKIIRICTAGRLWTIPIVQYIQKAEHSDVRQAPKSSLTGGVRRVFYNIQSSTNPTTPHSASWPHGYTDSNGFSIISCIKARSLIR